MSPAPVSLRLAIVLAAVATLFAVGCGSDSDAGGEATTRFSQEEEAAAAPDAASFPAAKGRTLRDLAELASPGSTLAPATQHFELGTSRFAFGLLGRGGEFIYAPSAVYVARSPGSKAAGPFVAPTDSLITETAFRSKQAATEGSSLASIYSTELVLPEKGGYSVLVLTRLGDQLIGDTSELAVDPGEAIPATGERVPAVETDTVAKAPIDEIDTREPPDTMHEVDFADVVGERPVALLFATPALCQSRVCGPVTDIAEQLKQEYGDEVEFIHQEVFVENDPAKGFREPLQRFALDTEPWLFTFDADGRVAARLEGSFGLGEFKAAVEAAL